MTREHVWVNADGIEVGFGTRDSINTQAASIRTTGRVNQVVVKIDSDTDVIDSDLRNSKAALIPAGSIIKSAALEIIKASSSASPRLIALTDPDNPLSFVQNSTLFFERFDNVGSVISTGSAIGRSYDTDAYISFLEDQLDLEGAELVITVEYIIGNEI